MRDYRGKTKEGKWVYGDLIHYPGGMAIVKCGEFTVKSSFEVIPESVGQDTGLKDKNDKMVFEGDIYKDYYAGNCKAREERMGKITVWEGNPIIKVFEDIRFASLFEGMDRRYIEVIGNTTDNPELLEEQK